MLAIALKEILDLNPFVGQAELLEERLVLGTGELPAFYARQIQTKKLDKTHCLGVNRRLDVLRGSR